MKTNRVYILLHDMGYDGQTIQAVFSTMSNAVVARDNLIRQGGLFSSENYWDIEVWDVDKEN